MNLQFTPEEAQAITWEDIDPKEYTIISNECIDTSGRWHNSWVCVFTTAKFPEKFFALDYRVGATESQDMDEADQFSCYGDDKVQAYEVEPVTKTTIVYEPVRQ